MKMRKAFILLLTVSVLSIVMMNPVAAQGTTISVEPEIVYVTPVPGSTFQIEIWVRNVVDLAGIEFKLSYNTAILTAKKIDYGGIFGVTYFALISKIDDTAGWLHYGIMEYFGEPGFTGDGKAAIITFSVDAEGESVLHLYATRLGNSAAKIIAHTSIDGILRNWPADTLPSDVYVGLTAGFVGDRHFTIAKDGTTQTLTGQIENMGKVPTSARVHFKVLLMGAPIPRGELTSVSVHLLPGETLRLSMSLDVTSLDRPAEYTVEVWVEYYGFTGWTLGRHGDPIGAKTTVALFFKLED